MAQLPTTYEEFLALPSEDRVRLHAFCTRHNVQQIAAVPFDDDDWDFPESPDSDDDWEYEIGENK
jgi:hypothetical protein